MIPMTHLLVLPGDGERVGRGPAQTRILATAESTDGRFTVSETTVPAGFPGPALHTHAAMTDSIYVLEGTLTIHVGDSSGDAPPGSYLCVPPGTVHSFSNRSGEPVRFLNITSPGGWERYLRDVAELMEQGAPTPEVWRNLMSRHDFIPIATRR